MKCLFVSDAHYPSNNKIIDFLIDSYGQYDIIFILGDLFEFYYGYKNFLYTHHMKLINMLNMISKKSRVILFEGNHEYNLKRIKDFLNVDVVEHYLNIEIDGLKLHLEHGDTIDKKDTAYRLFRAALKNTATLKIIDKLPPYFLLELSKMASSFSKKSLNNKRYRNTDKALETFAENKIREGFDYVILAHTHNPVVKKINKGTYINCGDFFNRFSYAVYESSEGFSLRFFDGGKYE